MGKKYWTVGTFFGIQLRIDYTWFIVFALIAWSVTAGYLPAYFKGLKPWQYIAAGLVVTTLFFLSVIVHEYAHSIVANRNGLRIRRITLFIFGGASELQGEPNNAKTELKMTAAGPLASLAIAAVAGLLWAAANKWHLTALEIIAQPMAVLNFVVALFNLLPAFPLDGGRILRSVLWLIRKDFAAATKGATNTGIVLSYVLVAIGILEIVAGYVLGGFWLMLVGFYLLQAARASYYMTLNEDILSNVQVGEIMDEGCESVSAKMAVEDFMSSYDLPYKQQDVFVVDEAGKLVGVVGLRQIAKASHGDPGAVVGDFAQPLAKSDVMKLSDSAIKAFRAMMSHNLDVLPVMSHGQPVGAISRRFLDRYVLVRRMQHMAH